MLYFFILWNIEKYFIDLLLSLQILKDLKTNKKFQSFIYNPISPDYQSTKKPFLKNASCFWCFTVLGVHTITDKIL